METINYRYDTLNRLIEAIYPDGTVICFRYDSAGNRIAAQTFVPGEKLPPVEPLPPLFLPLDLPAAAVVSPPEAPSEPKQKSNLRLILIVLCLISLCACIGFSGLAIWFWL